MIDLAEINERLETSRRIRTTFVEGSHSYNYWSGYISALDDLKRYAERQEFDGK